MHQIACASNKKTKKNQSLAALGITGTGDIDPKELCAVWCAEAARPFSALADPSHKSLLHPVVLKNLPTSKAVSKDIHLLYSAIQGEYRSVLQAHKGALYLGVDAWQSPNGFNNLGVVIYRLKVIEETDPQTQTTATELNFCCLLTKSNLTTSCFDHISHPDLQQGQLLSTFPSTNCHRPAPLEFHTGNYLAHVVRLVVEKFGIQDRICGIVSGNASNNEVMIKELKRLKWPRFQGKTHWIRCFSHILNLIAQGILQPFGTQKKRGTGNDRSTSIDNEETSLEEDNPDAQIKLLSPDEDVISHHDDDSSEVHLTDEKVIDDSESLNESDIENGSEEGEGDCYTSESCKHTLGKRLKRYGLDRKHYVDESDFDLARDLVDILNLFHEVTLQVSTAGSACLANIVVFIDQITEHLATAVVDTKYPPALRNACRVGLKITNKYYILTDSSPLYRIAILLHPSFRDEYFKLAKWEPKWISEAIRLAREMWVSHYKPRCERQPIKALFPLKLYSSQRVVPQRPITAPSATPTPISRPATGMLAGLSNAAAARGGNSHSDALDVWLAGGLILNGNEPVNPLKWWIQQKRAGNTHGGLEHL
ncbi:hypothetical protein PGTUg99_004602 [Puccinia graminis f. sp. tritici]|uniref:hAT-like transposase RNase-H fold domain-containing protein n=1 Tax=Puccinia graminis f. sp. tritici TaxID=56615 RepID=A0A5B0N7E7_PUCGR|nr:hypothetical protein PGTUg99_004602 [Puccinia graminis f. sp. tritici]